MAKEQHTSNYPDVKPNPSASPSIEWLGMGLYTMRNDQVWVHYDTVHGLPKGFQHFENRLEIAARLGNITVVDGEASIQQTLWRLHLPLQDFYSGIENPKLFGRTECLALATEAERWRISYHWGEDELHRFIFGPRKYFSFLWSYGKKSIFG